MKWVFTLCFELIVQITFAQQKDQFFIFDKDWKPSNIKKAAYFLRVRLTADSNYEWLYYKIFGPRIKQESFKDVKATIRNGKFVYYGNDGTIDSSGVYVNNELNGLWLYRSENGKIIRQRDYHNGTIIKDTIIIIENPNGQIPIKPGEIESEYPGGQAAWNQYLRKNLHYPDRAVNAEVMGDVLVQFIVDPDGNIIRPEIRKSVEYSLDEEALRIIKESINWVPASKDGRNVKSYKIQPIKFRLSKG